MLQLTRLSGPVFALNPDLIERAEATPDTVVTLVNGSKYVIRESLAELVELIRDYRAGLVAAAQARGDLEPGSVSAVVATEAARTASVRRDLPRHGHVPDSQATVVALHPGEL